MQGTSFLPLIENPNLEWKSAAFSQFHRRPKVSADGKRYMGYSLNTSKYHYIEWYTWNHKTGTKGDLKAIELYDSVKDPHEQTNIAQLKALDDIKKELAIQLAKGWRAALPEYKR